MHHIQDVVTACELAISGLLFVCFVIRIIQFFRG